MSELKLIAVDSPLFPGAWEMLRRSICGSDQTTNDVMNRLCAGGAQMWALVVSGQVAGALVTAIEGGVLFVMHLAAEAFDLLAPHWCELEAYGRDHGAGVIRGRCTPRAARFFNAAVGSQTLYCVVEQKL
jgi:hypothetical protein